MRGGKGEGYINKIVHERRMFQHSPFKLFPGLFCKGVSS